LPPTRRQADAPVVRSYRCHRSLRCAVEAVEPCAGGPSHPRPAPACGVLLAETADEVAGGTLLTALVVVAPLAPVAAPGNTAVVVTSSLAAAVVVPVAEVIARDGAAERSRLRARR